MREAVDGNVAPMQAPVMGLNKRLPLPSIPEGFAIRLVNMIPTQTGVKKRNGSERITDNAFTSACKTVMSHNAANGTDTVIIAGDNDLATVDLNDGSKTSVKGATTITENRWQWINFKGRLFTVNGADRCLVYTGAGNFADAGFTISAAPDDDLLNIGLYNRHLWFTLKDSTTCYYAEAGGNITGALEEFDPGEYLTLGGSVLFAGSTHQNMGYRSAEVMCFITSKGEILTFTGSSPSFSTWQFLARYVIPEPIDVRSFEYRGGTLNILTQEGVIPMVEIMESARFQQQGKYQSISENLDEDFVLAAKTYGTLEGWQMQSYSRGNMLIVNIPLSTTAATQFVMNSTTGAWGTFQALNAACWCVSSRVAFFGGMDGHLYRFDLVKNDNIYEASAGDPIDIFGETSFSGLDNPIINKIFSLIRPLIYATANTQLEIAINTDYRRGAIPTNIDIAATTPGAEWDAALWDVAEWADSQEVVEEWRAVEGDGRVLNIVFQGSLSNVDLELLGFLVQYKAGGVL